MNTENRQKHYSLKPYFYSKGYFLSAAITLFIFFLGFKWTLLGAFWIPVIINPFIYAFVIIAWIYYNYVWLRTALYLPSTMLGVRRVYARFGVRLSWLKCFYITLCKANKIRKEDITLKRQDEYVKVLASTFTKPAVMVNFKRGEAHQLSTAIFIHIRHKVMELHRALIPYMVPTFIVILLLTPLFVFLPAYNYSFLAEKLNHTPPLMSFTMYILILPVKIVWVFKMLSLLAMNVVSPLLVMPATDLFAAYAKETNLKVQLKKRHTLSFDALMACVMIFTSLAFYISILANILL